MCRVEVLLILKNVSRRERSVINVNLKIYSRKIQHLVTDLEMELLVKIINDFKL